MMQNRSSIASRLCLWAFAATLGACATGQDLRETSKKFEGQTESVRTSLEAKIEQLKQTQREAEKSLARIEQLIEDNKREQSQTRELAAKLNSDLRSFREMDLTKVEGRIERAKKDIEALQGRVEDQVSSLRQNALQWLAILDEKQTAKLDQQVARVDQQVAKVEAREARIQETLTTLGKKIDERIKKVEDDGRATTDNLAAHLSEVDKSLAQVSETVKTVGTKLSTQLEQQGGSLARLEEANKQADGQIRTLTPRVDQLKTSLGDLAKVLHTLTEKSAEIDRRVADVSGGSEQGAKMEARIEAPSTAPSEPDQPDVPSNGAGRPNIEASVSPESAYEHAYQEFQQNQFENALVSFRNFLSQYPTSNLVPNAHFWIAECYVKKRDYQKSLNAYEEVIRHHPKSGKASIALYRKALVLLELKDKVAAKTALKKLIADYPRSEESKQARTKLASLQ